MENPTSHTSPWRETRIRVRDLLAAGVKVRDIAKALDISTQRVYQLQKEFRAAGELEERSA